MFTYEIKKWLSYKLILKYMILFIGFCCAGLYILDMNLNDPYIDDVYLNFISIVDQIVMVSQIIIIFLVGRLFSGEKDLNIYELLLTMKNRHRILEVQKVKLTFFYAFLFALMDNVFLIWGYFITYPKRTDLINRKAYIIELSNGRKIYSISELLINKAFIIFIAILSTAILTLILSYRVKKTMNCIVLMLLMFILCSIVPTGNLIGNLTRFTPFLFGGSSLGYKIILCISDWRINLYQIIGLGYLSVITVGYILFKIKEV